MILNLPPLPTAIPVVRADTTSARTQPSIRTAATPTNVRRQELVSATGVSGMIRLESGIRGVPWNAQSNLIDAAESARQKAITLGVPEEQVTVRISVLRDANKKTVGYQVSAGPSKASQATRENSVVLVTNSEGIVTPSR